MYRETIHIQNFDRIERAVRKLTGDLAYVEGKINKSVIVLKTKFLKKA